MAASSIFLIQAFVIVAVPVVLLRISGLKGLLPLVAVRIMLGIALGPSFFGKVAPAYFQRRRHIKFAWSMPNGGSWSKVMLKGLRLSRCSKGSTLRFVHDAFHLRTVDPGDDETGWRSDRGWREISEHAALI